MRGASPLLALPSYFRQISKRGKSPRTLWVIVCPVSCAGAFKTRVPALYGFQVQGLLKPRKPNNPPNIMHRELKNKEYYSGYIMNDSFTEWLKTCPKEYIWQMNQVTEDKGIYTFFLEDVV